jgi:hypothetical protein
LQDRAAAFQECVQGGGVVVVLPAFERGESQRFDLRVAKLHLMRRRRHARRRDQAKRQAAADIDAKTK